MDGPSVFVTHHQILFLVGDVVGTEPDGGEPEAHETRTLVFGAAAIHVPHQSELSLFDGALAYP